MLYHLGKKKPLSSALATPRASLCLSNTDLHGGVQKGAPVQAVQVPGALLLERSWPCGDCRLLRRENKLLGAESHWFWHFLSHSFPFDSATLGAVHSNALLMSWALQGADMRA